MNILLLIQKNLYSHFIFYSGSEDNEWKRITNMVDDKISNSETRTHFKNVRLLLKEFRVIMKKCPENLDAHDVTRLMIKKELFFPQNYPTMQFSINWVAALNAWLTCVVALYMELIKNNAISNKCALAEELAAMKGEVEEALKVLHYKRYRIVRGIDYYQGSSYNSPAALQFEDVLTGEKFPKEFKKGDNGRYLKVKIKDTYSVLFGEIRESTFDKTDSLRKRFNNLTTSLSEKFKADGCKLIDLIPVKKNKVDYPESCFGDSSSADPCFLPCDTYGTTEFFCPNGNIFGNSGNHGRLHGYNNNNPCKKNWDSCITYNETKDALLFDAGWSLIKKKKATKKLKPKTTLFKI